MGLSRRPVLLLVLALVLLFPVRALAAPLPEDEVVFGGKYVLETGATLDGDLLVIAGEVEIHTGAHVSGNVIVMGGTVSIAGTVGGDLTQLGGQLTLEDDAHLRGDLVANGGAYERAEGARIDGETRQDVQEVADLPERPWGLGATILDGFWNLFILFSTAALAVVVTILWPQRLEVIGESIAANPVMAGSVGLLTVGVVVPLLLLATLTLILIPVSLVGFIVLAGATAFGWVGLSHEIGKRIAQLGKQTWSPGLAAGLGAIVLGIVYLGVGEIPCLGWAVQAMIGLIGLGAVTLTRFGQS